MRLTDSAVLFALAAVIMVAAVAVKTWLLMLLIGIVHADVLPAVHPVGFLTCIPLAILVHFVFATDANVRTSK